MFGKIVNSYDKKLRLKLEFFAYKDLRKYCLVTLRHTFESEIKVNKRFYKFNKKMRNSLFRIVNLETRNFKHIWNNPSPVEGVELEKPSMNKCKKTKCKKMISRQLKESNVRNH